MENIGKIMFAKSLCNEYDLQKILRKLRKTYDKVVYLVKAQKSVLGAFFISIFHFCIIFIYTMSEKKSLWYFMCNYNTFKDIFIIFGANHPESPLY